MPQRIWNIGSSGALLVLTAYGAGCHATSAGRSGGDAGESTTETSGGEAGGSGASRDVTCVDVTSDTKNCGSCGHDCLGGTCTGGQCQPVMIAQYTGNPELLYVGAEAVYVTTDLGYVGRAQKDGSDLKPFAMPGFVSSVFIGTTLAEDGDRVFLVRYDGDALRVSYCLATGCDATATPIGGPHTQLFAVDQTDHKVVWLEDSPRRFVSASTLGTPSGVDIPGESPSSGAEIDRLFYSQGGIYFADGAHLDRKPISGGSIGRVTVGDMPLAILGANSSAMFLYDGTAIASVPLPSGDGGRPKPLFAATVDSSLDGHFVADDNAIYWANNGIAMTCRLSDCPGTITTLPKRSGDSIADVGIDSTAIYWVAGGSFVNSTSACTVWKLAR
jgi:hypothetical protein